MPKQAQAKTNRKNVPLPKGRSRNAPVRSDNAADAENERDLKDARSALKEARQKGSVPWEQVKRELGI